MESYVDGELGEVTRQRLRTHVASCRDCNAQVIMAERIRHGIDRLPLPSCPERVSDAVFAQIALPSKSQEGLKGWLSHALARAASIFGVNSSGSYGLRPALALLAVLALGAAFWLGSGREPAPAVASHDTELIANHEVVASDEEVRQAEEEIKIALAYLGKISQKAGDSVTQGVLGHRALAPIARALAPLLTPSDKAEKSAG
jgi:anti-sigma factor RsiW